MNASTNMIKISIIICTHNRAEHLQATLASIAEVRVPADLQSELIVVDNASTDNTRKVIEEAQISNLVVRYVYEPKPGQCQARNTGIAQSVGQVLLWTDDDVRVPEHWIEAMCRPLLNGEYDAMAGGVQMAPHLERPWMTEGIRGGLAETGRLNPENPADLVGANMAFARRVLEKVPAFDTEIGPGALGFGDDTLFAFQIVQAGYRIGSRLDVYIEHHFEETRLTRPSFESAAKKMGRSWGYVAHHWEHKVLSPWPEVLKSSIKYSILKILKSRKWRAVEGMDEEEFKIIFYTYLMKGYIAARKNQRNYEDHGLVKIRHSEN